MSGNSRSTQAGAVQEAPSPRGVTGICRSSFSLRRSAVVPVSSHPTRTGFALWKAARANATRALCLFACLVAGLRVHAAEPTWEPGPGYRSRSLEVRQGNQVGFTLLPPAATGIGFANLIPEQRHLTNQILLNGSGVAAGDVDGDGWCDVFFAALDRGCRLYRNLGDGRFGDITASSGVACAGVTATGAALADLDGDADLDLLVNSVGNGTRVFHNDGSGRFALARLLNEGRGGTSLALADIDGDGYLDVYVANYRTSALMDIANARATFARIDGRVELETLNGRPVTAPDLTNRFVIGPGGSIDELGEPDVLYRNLGGTNFVAVPFPGGAFEDEDGKPLARPLYEWGLTAVFRDLNQDTLPDLFVCNDFHAPDRLWYNLGQGRFRLAPPLALRRTSLFSMAADFADVNRDGRDDLFVLDMLSRDHQQRMRYLSDSSRSPRVIGRFEDRPQYGIDVLFLNRGDGTFAEVAQLAGLEAAEWAWSCVFVDVDLDGWEDLLVANGMERAARDMDVAERLKMLRTTRQLTDADVFNARRMFPRLATANLAFRNRGDLTFEEVGAAWRFDLRGVSQGMALADLDRDGDLDLLVNNFNAPAAVLRNETSAPRLAVSLRGHPPNTRGIGARIEVVGGGLPPQSQEIVAGGRYMSSDEPLRVFAAGSITNQLRIQVTWRNGRRSVIPDALPNRLYEIQQPADEGTDGSTAAASGAQVELAAKAMAPAVAPWFEDVSPALGHVHSETPYDDLARQPLLPNYLSQLGPGLAWFDLDGDARDDLFVGTGTGGSLGAFRNLGAGRFARFTNATFQARSPGDLTGIVGWHRVPGQPAILVGVSAYEAATARGFTLRSFAPDSAVADESFESAAVAVGPIAVGDYDADGDLDVFVGGRVVPGRYPEAAASVLLRNDAGKLTRDPGGSPVLDKAGLVSGCLFTDLDGDGRPELVLACEWGPPRVLRREEGRWIDWNPRVTVDQRPPGTLRDLTGWWTAVAAGDFDADGRLDLLAGNWGRNSKSERHRAKPLRLDYGDLDEDGALEVLESYYDPALNKYVPARQLDVLARSLPFLRARYPSHRAFSLAGIEDFLGERMVGLGRLEAVWLETTLLLNRGDHFEARVLPLEAQVSPAFGLVVADFDGDGHADVFLAQNFFAVQPETPRLDAGRGLWLRGDGHGKFVAVPGAESGLLVYGEQRGAATADFDRDGRPDLAVSQNGAPTKLYRNLTGRPGLRVRLRGPPGNPTAVGAAVRGVDGGKAGPVWEIRAGSGYWSQDSPTLVLTAPTAVERVRVRWPGGQESEHIVPAGAREIEVTPTTLRVLEPE